MTSSTPFSTALRPCGKAFVAPPEDNLREIAASSLMGRLNGLDNAPKWGKADVTLKERADSAGVASRYSLLRVAHFRSNFDD
jgi:hypothetical protein